VTNLHTLNARGLLDSSQVHLLEADYRDATTYETRGISLHETGLIFNYPDGNDHHLARFVADHCGHDTILCLLTHNRTLELDELAQWASHDVSDPSGPRWRLSLYSRTSGQNRGHLQESQDR
jgi:hypothetical protein